MAPRFGGIKPKKIILYKAQQWIEVGLLTQHQSIHRNESRREPWERVTHMQYISLQQSHEQIEITPTPWWMRNQHFNLRWSNWSFSLPNSAVLFNQFPQEHGPQGACWSHLSPQGKQNDSDNHFACDFACACVLSWSDSKEVAKTRSLENRISPQQAWVFFPFFFFPSVFLISEHRLNCAAG